MFCIDAFGCITEGTITNIRTIADKTDKLDNITIYYIKTHIGEYTCLQDDVFKTYGEALTEITKRKKNKTKEYEKQIKNLPELFSFMLSQMHCEEYTDYEAIEASKNKIKELLGIEI